MKYGRRDISYFFAVKTNLSAQTILHINCMDLLLDIVIILECALCKFSSFALKCLWTIGVQMVVWA